MIIWLFLFLVIVVISFILAYQSMKDYEEQSSFTDASGVFFIRNPQNLNSDFLNRLHQEISKTKQTISLERIFKGQRQALIISGSKQILEKFSELNLLELEDYTSNIQGEVLAWEIGTKNTINLHLKTEEIAKAYFENIPPLNDEEQFYFQTIIRAEKGSLWPKVKAKSEGVITKLLQTVGILSSIDPELKKAVKDNAENQEIYKHKKSQKVFSSQIRIVFSGEEHRLKELSEPLSGSAESNLLKIPRPLTSSQIFNVYKQRKFLVPITNNLMLTSEEIGSFYKAA